MFKKIKEKLPGFNGKHKDYKLLFEHESKQRQLFEEAYIKSKSNFDKLTQITNDIITLYSEERDPNNSDCISPERIMEIIEEKLK